MDYDTYLREVARHVTEKGETTLIELSKIRNFAIQAEVETQLLTGTPEWDHFLSRLVAAQDQVKAERGITIETLSSHTTVEEAVIRGLKAKLAWLDGMNWALSQVIELPKDIKENGALARSIELPELSA